MFASIIQGAGTSASVRLDTTDGQPTTIDWGDGTVVKNNSGSTASHTYAAAYNGPVKIRTASRSSQITRFDSSSGNWSFNLSALPRSLTYLSLNGNGLTVSGSIAGLTALTYLNLNGGTGSTVSGSIAGLTSLTYLYLNGNGVTVIVPDAWTGVTSGAREVYGRSYTVATSTIDNLLISLAAVVVSWSNEKTVNLKGSRTSASDAAVTTLNGKGVTVTVSP